MALGKLSAFTKLNKKPDDERPGPAAAPGLGGSGKKEESFKERLTKTAQGPGRKLVEKGVTKGAKMGFDALFAENPSQRNPDTEAAYQEQRAGERADLRPTYELPGMPSDIVMPEPRIFGTGDVSPADATTVDPSQIFGEFGGPSGAAGDVGTTGTLASTAPSSGGFSNLGMGDMSGYGALLGQVLGLIGGLTGNSDISQAANLITTPLGFTSGAMALGNLAPHLGNIISSFAPQAGNALIQGGAQAGSQVGAQMAANLAAQGGAQAGATTGTSALASLAPAASGVLAALAPVIAWGMNELNYVDPGSWGRIGKTATGMASRAQSGLQANDFLNTLRTQGVTNPSALAEALVRGSANLRPVYEGLAHPHGGVLDAGTYISKTGEANIAKYQGDTQQSIQNLADITGYLLASGVPPEAIGALTSPDIGIKQLDQGVRDPGLSHFGWSMANTGLDRRPGLIGGQGTFDVSASPETVESIYGGPLWTMFGGLRGLGSDYGINLGAKNWVPGQDLSKLTGPKINIGRSTPLQPQTTSGWTFSEEGTPGAFQTTTQRLTPLEQNTLYSYRDVTEPVGGAGGNWMPNPAEAPSYDTKAINPRTDTRSNADLLAAYFPDLDLAGNKNLMATLQRGASSGTGAGFNQLGGSGPQGTNLLGATGFAGLKGPLGEILGGDESTRV